MQITELITCAQMAIAVMVFAGLAYLGVRVSPRKIMLQAYEVICMRAKKEKHFGWDYDKWNAFLVANGAAFHYGKWINPVSYIALCLVMAVSGFTIGTAFSLWAACMMGTVGALLPGILLEYLNKMDNEKMLTELDMVYSALGIQIRAGVFVADALSECSSSVRHPRLLAALQELCSDLIVKAELGSALEAMQKKFNNKYIDMLCITIIQSGESGQALELLGDIAEQIKDMEAVIQQRKKERLNRSTTFYQLGVFVISLGLTLYLCITDMLSAALFFR